MALIGFDKHDHESCMSGGIDRVVQTCAAKGLRLTKSRRRVMEILLSEHRAMGAYEILDQLRAEGLGSQPPIVYRALDFLISNGFVHKIERLNAYIACSAPGDDHTPAFMICRSCDLVAEASAEGLRGQLKSTATGSGFVIERTVMEAEGLCSACAKSE